MRKLLLSATALTAMATVASAADLPARAPAVAPAPVYAPVFTWTGFYVGVNAGAAWNNKCGDWTPAFGGAAVVGWTTLCNNNNNDNVGFTGGAQAGYNWQVGAFVFGLEADINGVANGNNNNTTFALVPAGGVFPAGAYQLHENRPDWFGTVRGRLGYAFNQSLLYVTGGFAYGGNRNASVNYWATGGAVPPAAGVAPTASFATSNNNGIGWSLGAGWEYAFNNNWTARVEYLHVALGNDNNGAVVCSPVAGCGAFATTTWNRSNHNSFDVVRVGLNYKFGGAAAAPVLARY